MSYSSVTQMSANRYPVIYVYKSKQLLATFTHSGLLKLNTS